MGTSTDAMLAFGVQVGDEDETPAFMDGFQDFEDYLNSLSGLPAYGEDGHSFDDLRNKIPAGMVLHCSADYPMFLLVVRGSEVLANRGYPVEMDALPVIETERLASFI